MRAGPFSDGRVCLKGKLGVSASGRAFVAAPTGEIHYAGSDPCFPAVLLIRGAYLELLGRVRPRVRLVRLAWASRFCLAASAAKLAPMRRLDAWIRGACQSALSPRVCLRFAAFSTARDRAIACNCRSRAVLGDRLPKAANYLPPRRNGTPSGRFLRETREVAAELATCSAQAGCLHSAA
jgi:hypothetical protein